MFGSLKRKWNNYLERLASVNEKLYGDQRLDCCGLNHQSSYSQKLQQPHATGSGNTNGN